MTFIASGIFTASVTAQKAEAADLVIAVPNWPSGQATANILKVAIGKTFGLKADLREMGELNAFAGLEAGEVDIHPEVWRPNLDAAVAKYVDEKKAVVLAKRAVAAWQGLCATEEAEKAGIKDIKDLSDPKKGALLDTDGDGRGELWIGAETWTSTAIERVRANSFGYAGNLALVEAEEDVGMAAVDAAVATGRPMVFACYAPHNVFELHKVTRLEEPAYDPARWKIVAGSDPLWVEHSKADVAWPPSSFNIAWSASFGAKHADVAAFLDKVDLTPQEVTKMTYALQVERIPPADYAEKWVADHAARIDGWAKP
ncbi:MULTISPECIES: glycine betaine ABC transporter substrate-binding protein [unclassified Rhizobium]|uniref:ABC transporter substrate-binding protein n=1 Tax=unclassified Rhizobium TaxID=2613769 RepID=UPI0014046219|nr:MULTISPECIES: glycine betaine ABC transporter substrate-binding protein [unclassified Rhizobium]